MATTTNLLTAEQFYQLPDPGRPAELVRGEVMMMNMPGYRHSVVCARITRLVGNFVEEHGLGTVVSNDGGIITERDPDSVRGADVAFYSYARLPKEQRPEGYPPVPPELVFEVKSPSDRWKDLHTKVAEYLQAGVTIVCVVDPETESVIAYYADRQEATLRRDDDLTLEPVLSGFTIPVAKLFD